MRRFSNGTISLLTLSILFLIASIGTPAPALAVSSKFLDVCASGCTYTTVQSALAAVSSPSADNRYTIFIDAGVVDSSTSISLGGLSWITIQGRGIGASVIRANGTWFNTGGNFLDLSSSHDVTIRGVTIDAATQAPYGLNSSNVYTAVLTDNAYNLLIDSTQVLGVSIGIWETTNSAGNRIDITNSIIRSQEYGIYITSPAAWHIFSTDIRAVRADSDRIAYGTIVALDISTGTGVAANVTVWGSHMHAEYNSGITPPGSVNALRFLAYSGITTIVGSTLHAKTAAELSSGANANSIYLGNSFARLNVVGSDLLYETPSGVTNGRFGAIGYILGSINAEVQLTGSNMLDAGGSGGQRRTDIYYNALSGTSSQPRFRFGALHSLQNPQKGTVTLSAGTATITLSPTQADLFYNVVLTSAANETLSVTSKSTTQFTISSSNGSSTAVVEYVVVR